MERVRLSCALGEVFSPSALVDRACLSVCLSNGGAGATGLIKALAEDYITTLSEEVSIDWVCNHSRNTQLALLHSYIDIALTYERDQEDLAASEGWSKAVGCVFHDHFCLVGPSTDPANVRSASTLPKAFHSIAYSKSLFHSRADSSATMWKERSIWATAGLEPWIDEAAASWYKTRLESPAEALIAGDAAGAYLLTDRSTLLRQTSLQTIHNTTVFFEPMVADDSLMNSCYALIPSRIPKERVAVIDSFLNYLASDRGQDVVADFGSEELGGFSLFAPVKDRFARSYLGGGMSSNGKWVISKGEVTS